MNTAHLIDAIVQQTTVLIAQLATTAGIRAPLAHLANQVFLDLVTELENQGVGRKVVADMFGIALRSYQRKVRRIAESATVRDRTLWEAVLDHIQSHQVVRRADLLLRFARDDEDVVRAVLHDLVESGLVYRTGRGAATVYRAADPAEVGAGDEAVRLQAFVWSLVYRHGPLTVEDLAQRAGLEATDAQAALDALLAEGRVEDTTAGWQCATFILSEADPSGWETPLFHHFQALVIALTRKLSGQPAPPNAQGGSTYEFLVWDGHPQAAEIFGLLAEVRARASALRAANTEHNERVGRPEHATRVTFYMGQSVIPGEDEECE